MKNKQQKIKQKIEHYINTSAASENKLFEFFYDDAEYGEEYDDDYYDDVVCLTQINVPKDNPKLNIRIPSFVTYLHYSVISENRTLRL